MRLPMANSATHVTGFILGVGRLRFPLITLSGYDVRAILFYVIVALATITGGGSLVSWSPTTLSPRSVSIMLFTLVRPGGPLLGRG